MPRAKGGAVEGDLRDWFAGMALGGWIAGPLQGDVMDEYEDLDETFRQHAEMVAEICYMYADAMLAKRKRSTKPPRMERSCVPIKGRGRS